jgi:3',5'-cyclic AMP phosphodiesterase CpdA
VVKGDITNKGLADEWRLAAPLLAHAPLPVLAVPGNHDVKASAEVDARDALAAHGVEVASPVAVRDVPGLRIVALDTTVADLHAGRVHDVEDELLSALADAARDGRPALVAMHHHLQTGLLPARWPPGVPIRASRGLLRAIGAANPHTLVTSGHTHRHRRHQFGPIVTDTVGSVKDYPGVWAAYAVHEGGIRQEVRRVARPDVMRWTERSGRALLGAYRWWTPGSLASRCFTLDWSTGPRAAG